MKLVALVLLLAAGPMLAQDRDAETAKLLEKADQLEKQAAKALDEGRNVQAIELLTKAADLREAARARDAKRLEQKEEARQRAKAKKAKAEAETGRKRAEAERGDAQRRRRAQAERMPGTAALAAMDAALEKGDLKAAADAARAARRELAQWQKRLEKRERELRRRAPPAPPGFEERVAALEKQVAALRRMLESER